LRAQRADPRDGAELLDGVTKAGERGIGLAVDLGDAGIKGVDLLQMQSEQETMLALDAPAQCFAQRSRGGPDLGMCQRRQFDRVGLAVDQRLDHRPIAAPHHVGKY
jgi:hypothetical protein